MTGADVVLRTAIAACEGDPVALIAARENGASWPLADLEVAVTRMRAELAGPFAWVFGPFEGVPGPDWRPPARPDVSRRSHRQAALIAAGKWAARFNDDGVAVGMAQMIAREHGIELDRERARQLVEAARRGRRRAA